MRKRKALPSPPTGGRRYQPSLQGRLELPHHRRLAAPENEYPFPLAVVLNLMLSQSNLDINKVTRHGNALHIAAQLDDPEIIKLLMNHPNIDAKYESLA